MKLLHIWIIIWVISFVMIFSNPLFNWEVPFGFSSMGMIYEIWGAIE